MLALGQAVEKTGLPAQLVNLIDFRVSQINNWRIASTYLKDRTRRR